VVRAECRERKEAKATYAEARQRGHRAALLTAERADVHTLRVSNLPPGEEVRVRIVVVERLSASDGRFEWRLPTTIAPRFLVGEGVGHDGPGTLPDTDRVPDASRLQPPIRLMGGTELDLEVEIAGPLTELASSQHAIRMELGSSVTVAPSGSATLDRDFVIRFATGDASTVCVRAYTDGKHTLVMVEPPLDALPTVLPRDAVFLVDISGSMGGTKMHAAKEALSTALHGLVEGDRFKLIAFDDKVEHFAPDWTTYTDRTLGRADAWVAKLHARGGTRMLEPIRAALEGDTPTGRLRTVLFITDGQAHNEAELTAAVANRRKQGRFHCLGIDTAVNAALLHRLGRVGGGTAELLSPTDDIEGAVARFESRFGSPVLTDVKVAGLVVAELAPVDVYAGRPAVLLCEGTADEVEVVVQAGDGARTLRGVPVASTIELGALWARQRIASLQDRLLIKPFEEDAIEPEILRIALAHSIGSRLTAFVAVERTRTIKGELVQVVQPTELPAQWDRGFAAPPAQAPMRSITMASGMPVSDAPVARSAPRKRKASLSRSLADKVQAVFGVGSSRAGGGGVLSEAEEGAPMEAPAGARRSVGRRPADPAATVARAQGADGSFGGDVERTVAAVLLLILLGHTRRRGTRSRIVLKAVRWLERHRGSASVEVAMSALLAAERGDAVTGEPAWAAVAPGTVEGRALAAML
jgi:Ca-activated chloride channel family protein